MPPKVAHKVENTIKSLAVKDVKKRRIIKEARIPRKAQLTKKDRRFPLKELIFGGAVVVFLFGIYFYNKLPVATIEIYPKLDLVTLESKITADNSAGEIDLQKKIIPLKFLEEVKEASQEFPATGITSKDGKATGIIKIYNKLSPATPLTLISGTHFLSDSGKYFITLSKVTIPAMKEKTPGSISVKVQAKDVGTEYNIGPSKFSVPKLSGTVYYYGIWGESEDSMSGGYTGKVKKVTKDDLDSAEDVLTEKLLQDTENYLKNKISQEEVLLEGAIKSNVVESTSDTKAEAIADKFNHSAKVKSQALVIKKQDLEMFIKDSILSQLPEGKNLLENSLNFSYDADFVDFAHKVEKVNLKAEAEVYSALDFSDVVDLLKGKSSFQIKEIINSQYGQEISGIQVKLWPFWVKKAPKDENRIKINLNFK